MEILGVDIGGSGIKGAPVDVEKGEFTQDRLRLTTPEGAPPQEVARVVAEIVAHFGWEGPVGVTFPGVVTGGVVRTAANLGDAWIDLAARDLFAEASGVPVTLLNDADAAGIAEMTFGVGRDRPGTVLMLTLGTGVGTALFLDGRLVPNTELGHIEIRGKDAERRASAHAREVHEWDWQDWSKRLGEYLRRIEDLLWPSLIIVGGGVSKKADRFLPLLKDVRTPVVPAELHNDAGIIGAAMAAVPGKELV
ncbi:ROK family protein [Actinoallomurus purpureus]|uniref:polyphosphate--glucose phosphotransferase n=1 Tax=Actinoallomurus purpureus TaxID=478114 RepID=UPI002091E9B1|nr:ROK family protein [Actinoallomurus purpureus]MCO6005609.1 ROK family protein [Actinoallomurus purpureus]